MPGNHPPYHNKMRTPAKVNARITLDLIKADKYYKNRFDPNTYVVTEKGTSDPDSFKHDILSNTHTDSNPNAVVLGDLIVGAAGPVWDRLAVGAVGQVLTVLPGGIPGYANVAGTASTIGPTSIPANEYVAVNCGAVITDALNSLVQVCCQCANTGSVFYAMQNMARVAGMITYSWYVDSGDLYAQIFNDSDVDVEAMTWVTMV